MSNWVESLGLSEITTPLFSLSLSIIPWVLIWILFALIYIVMPNTKVKIKSGFIAAIVAGTAFQLTEIIFIKFQVGVAGYNAIYGGFAALPLLLIWLQLSWLIVLFGAEISYAIQNVDSYEYAPKLNDLSISQRRLITIYIAYSGVNAFAKDNGSQTATAIAEKLGIPLNIVQDAIDELVKAKLFSQTFSDAEKEATFQPATDIQRITISFVTERLDHAGSNELPVTSTNELKTISDLLKTFEYELRISQANKKLIEL
jgi:membrane protein